MDLITIADQLVRELQPLEFSTPVTHVYNPLAYARSAYARYVSEYGQGTRDIVLLGMNPGPFGMAQTGVPFGDPEMVKTFLGIEAPVQRPAPEHPKRPVLGFACPRREVSGQRVWGWAKARYGTPGAFFARFFVANYCPLVFMEETGRNRTPDALPAAEKAPLFAACDAALDAMVEVLKPCLVIGIGKFAEQRARLALARRTVRIGGALHPSPASPAANRGWAEAFEQQVEALWELTACPKRPPAQPLA